MLEVIYGDLDDQRSPKDPDEAQCTPPMGRKFVRSAPSSYAASLAVTAWRGDEAPTVAEVIDRLRGYETNLSSSLVSAVEKLSQEVQQLKEDMPCSPPRQSGVAAVRNRRPLAQRRGYTPRATLWFYLRDHGEDTMRWEGKPTSALEARVRELRGRRVSQGGSSRRAAAPVSGEQVPRQRRRSADLFLSVTEGLLLHIYRK